MGNVAATPRKRMILGSSEAVTVDLTMSGSYATNGDSLPSDSALGLKNKGLEALILLGGGDTGYMLVVDHTNRKIKAYRQSAATGALQEVPNTTSLSSVVVRALAISSPDA